VKERINTGILNIGTMGRRRFITAWQAFNWIFTTPAIDFILSILHIHNKCSKTANVLTKVIAMEQWPPRSLYSIAYVGWFQMPQRCDQILFKFDLCKVNHTFYCTQKKKSRNIRSGDLAGHATGPPRPIYLPPKVSIRWLLQPQYAGAQLDWQCDHCSLSAPWEINKRIFVCLFSNVLDYCLHRRHCDDCALWFN